MASEAGFPLGRQFGGSELSTFMEGRVCVCTHVCVCVIRNAQVSSSV